MSRIFGYLFGPTLYRIYNINPGIAGDRIYQGNAAERYGSLIVAVVNSMFSLGYYSSPFLVIYLYRHDWCNHQGASLLLRALAGLGCLYAAGLCTRAVGRGTSPTYGKFLDVLVACQRDFSPGNKDWLSQYDFDFKAWPVEFSARAGADRLMFAPRTDWRQAGIAFLPHRFLSWLMVQSFGISLVYPGSIGLLHAALSENLREGRASCILEKNGKRSKLMTADGNEIDVMFFDRRGLTTKGRTLVISCEGNGGFYEVGMAGTPIEAGYSVLGWNHPGFAGSTGSPFPSQEANAIDAVMQFAITRLGFYPESIVLHGWSIGGYTASWAAMNYPDVKGIVLDATFDDLLPLALPRMPALVSGLVRVAVTEYINLNVADQLIKYNGPVLLIRRSQDEMIATNPNDLGTNRGNHLLRRLLLHRYPFVFDTDVGIETLVTFLAARGSAQNELLRTFYVDEQEMGRLLSTEDGRTFPSKLGRGLRDRDRARLGLYLARKYMVEFDSTHCTQLPATFFDTLWDGSAVTNVKS